MMGISKGCTSQLSLPTLCLLVVLGAIATVDAKQKNWVLIVAGANTYDNYFSQSTSCHAYHTVRNAGVPAENIIQLSYDDVANSKKNPYPGNLVVLPNGTNFYPGCKIDYRGEEVTPKLFISVLKGDKDGVKKLIGRDGPVIESDSDDHVFVTMTDHGSPGAFYFPNYTPLSASALNHALKDMYTAKLYKKMVVYIESCESGSMFNGSLPDNINIYGSTCAKPDEPGWMCCWDAVRKVYVGTFYSNGWQFQTDKVDPTKVTLSQQYDEMKKACDTKSHPQEYGDISIHNQVLAEFQGNAHSSSVPHYTSKYSNSESSAGYEYVDGGLRFAGIDLHHPPMDMVTIATLARRLLDEEDPEERASLEAELESALAIKAAAKEFVKDIASVVVGSDRAYDAVVARETVKNPACYSDALDALTRSCPGLHFGKFPFIRKNLHVIINLCNRESYLKVIQGIEQVSRGCHAILP